MLNTKHIMKNYKWIDHQHFSIFHLVLYVFPYLKHTRLYICFCFTYQLYIADFHILVNSFTHIINC